MVCFAHFDFEMCFQPHVFSVFPLSRSPRGTLRLGTKCCPKKPISTWKTMFLNRWSFHIYPYLPSCWSAPRGCHGLPVILLCFGFATDKNLRWQPAWRPMHSFRTSFFRNELVCRDGSNFFPLSEEAPQPGCCCATCQCIVMAMHVSILMANQVFAEGTVF